MVTDEVTPLLKEFISKNSEAADVQWDRRMSPRLLFNPYSSKTEEHSNIAHYFLMAAAILDDTVVGYPENARMLLVYLNRAFGNKLFEIKKPHLFEEVIIKAYFHHDLGPNKKAASEIIASVNTFVKYKAERNLLKYAQKFTKPKDFLDDLAQNIPALSGPHKDRAWIYLRWMVRPQPDLQIYNHLHPQDLYVPLTKENANVAASLGIISSASPALWRDEQTSAEARQKLTNYAKTLFPQDPAKIDHPFFLLGRWLKQKPLNRHTLKSALEFLEQMKTITGQPRAYYQKMSNYKSGWEKKTALTLLQLHIPYGYETISFPLPNEIYTPDFILEKTVQGRKIILEPHFEMTKRQARKYALFKRTYGHQFLLILLLKNDLIPLYHQRRILTDDVADDVWPIEFIQLLAEKIKNDTYGQ
ncbi:DUF2400 family protein [Candidatus Bathycorpusculum sp.]|jgi:hypothetical protein|uniref:DUF2400 family protein n=1 Tax=Candidatus Bathycorpusculum sp. TaxID=2994959 RepID=UPI002828B6BB|nr:DUF2400 family protein [Candidatus Termitimicrobium sp.]MCL2686239.1 DUF2400 family protein [Candidatus Termitimicrobium sp.]